MKKETKQAKVWGFSPRDTDFAARAALSDNQMITSWNENIIEPMVEVMRSENQTAVLIIKGHSDREDTDGLDREQRRKIELDASIQRMNSAYDFTILTLRANYGLSLPDDFEDYEKIAISCMACGAANLVETDTNLSEDQRKINRRVSFILYRFID